MPPINLNETARTLDAGRLRTLQVIPVAIAVAVATACGAAILVHLTRPPLSGPPSYGEVSLVSLLSLVHVLLAVSLYGAAFMLYRKRVSTPPPAPATADTCLGIIRAASLLRLALLEAPALFGVVICIIASQRGVLHAEPLTWLNLASSAAFFIVLILTFPTRDRVTVLLTSMMAGTGS